MKLTDNARKQASLELAEASRETEWRHPSFMAELFVGRVRWEWIHPFPMQSDVDRREGDQFLELLEATLREHVDPEQVDHDGELPESALKALAAIGAFGMKIAPEYGGLGLSQTNYNRAIALVGSYCASTAVWLSAHQSIGVPQPLKLFGTEEQKHRYLPRLARGEISAFALTEPDVGSDPARLKTIATPTGDGSHYLLNGTKLWCTNGPRADILVVMAKTPPVHVDGKAKPQVTAFIVERTMPGFSVEHECRFQGLHGIRNGVLRFDNVRVPAANIIGAPGMGLKIALTTLNTGRLTLPAASSAINKYCLHHCREWVNQRVQWGAPVGEHQMVADKLARMSATTLATEAVTWLVSAMADRGDADIRLEAAIAKYFCTEAAWQVVDDAIQIRGGRGYETAASLAARGEAPIPFERLQRDIRINRIIEGTSEIMRLFIAREAMDGHFRRLMPLMDSRRSPGSKLAAGIKAAGFYAAWYPAQWLPVVLTPETRRLDPTNRAHLRYVRRASRRLARAIFHVMGRYRQALERRQLLLSRLVDAGVDLFAMTAALAYAEALLDRRPDDSSPQRLADLFCRDARDRIDRCLHALRHHHDDLTDRVAATYRHGEYQWLEVGIMTGFPASVRHHTGETFVPEPHPPSTRNNRQEVSS